MEQSAEKKSPRKFSRVVWNNGNGALLCYGCEVIIATGFDHEDKPHYCSTCVTQPGDIQ